MRQPHLRDMSVAGIIVERAAEDREVGRWVGSGPALRWGPGWGRLIECPHGFLAVSPFHNIPDLARPPVRRHHGGHVQQNHFAA
jgi:hypothetical protein